MVYLLHFDPPFRHARHAWVVIPGGRELLPGTTFAVDQVDSRMLSAAAEAGTAFVVERSVPGDRIRALQLRKRGGASRECTICRAATRVNAARSGTDSPGGRGGDVASGDGSTVRKWRRKLSRQGNSLMVAVPQDCTLNLHLLPADDLIICFDPRWGGFFIRPEHPRQLRPIEDERLRQVAEAAR